MKKGLLFLFLNVSSFGFGQKRLLTYSYKYYQGNVVHDMDSIQFFYSTWLGSLNENPPEFGYPIHSALPNWGYPRIDAIKYTTSEQWISNAPTAMPTESALSYNASNQIVMNEIVSGTTRSLYYYYPNGLLSSRVFESNTSGTWIEYARIENEYNAMGNVTRHFISQPNNSLYTLDSVFYQGNSSQYTRYVRYQSTDNITYHKLNETLVTLNGAEQVQADYYADVDNDILTPIEPLYRFDYTWTAGLLTQTELYIATNGTFSGPPSHVYDYTYNAANLPLTITETGGYLQKTEYTYDNDVFITSILHYNGDGNQNWYLDQSRDYIYESTVDVSSEHLVELNMYPNPTTNVVRIESEGIHSIEVFNTQGQLVLAQEGTNEISLDHLPSGNYQFVITTAKGAVTAQVVKN